MNYKFVCISEDHGPVIYGQWIYIILAGLNDYLANPGLIYVDVMKEKFV